MSQEKLKKVRESRNMKQGELAALLGMKQQQFSRYETGQRDIPLSTFINWCKVIKPTTSELEEILDLADTSAP